MKNEIFLQVKPGTLAPVIRDALERQGFKITGSGQAIMPGAPADLWVVPPTGVHPDEFKFVPDPA